MPTIGGGWVWHCLMQLDGGLDCYEPVGMKLEDLISMTRIGDPGLEEISTSRWGGGLVSEVVLAARDRLPDWDRESSLV